MASMSFHKNLYGGFNVRRYTIVHGFCFFKLFPMGCKELMHKTTDSGIHIQLYLSLIPRLTRIPHLYKEAELDTVTCTVCNQSPEPRADYPEDIACTA